MKKTVEKFTASSENAVINITVIDKTDMLSGVFLIFFIILYPAERMR